MPSLVWLLLYCTGVTSSVCRFFSCLSWNVGRKEIFRTRDKNTEKRQQNDTRNLEVREMAVCCVVGRVFVLRPRCLVKAESWYKIHCDITEPFYAQTLCKCQDVCRPSCVTWSIASTYFSSHFTKHWTDFNPSAWSDGHCPHTVNISCRGVMGTARMLHALTHSSISRQVREQM